MGNNYNHKPDNQRKGQGTDGKNNNAGNHQKSFGVKYVGAPYNFVPFPDKVVAVDPKQAAVHDRMEEGLISGEITYTVKAETPIFVDDGTEHFMSDEYGRYIIPGSSMRGLIRTNAQILSFSGFDDDIDDYWLMYRNVASGIKSLRESYNKDILGNKQVSIGNSGVKIGVLTNVKAGYLVKEGKKYVIYPTVVTSISRDLGKMNYYVVSERDAVKNHRNYPFFSKHPEYAQHVLKKGFEKYTDKFGRIHYKGTENKAFHPGFYKVSYESSLHRIIALGDPGQYTHKGFMISSGTIGEKKVHYVIPEMDQNPDKAIPVPQESVDAFKIDFENKKNTLKKNVEFFDLPKDSTAKPVFYIEHGKRLYFGFTPRLRLFYKFSVADGIRYEKAKYDYAAVLFGKKGESKTRVSFSDARLVSEPGFCKDVTVVLGEPKPTSYMDYIDQEDPKRPKDDANTYNTEGFGLRGVKQYWLRKDVVSGEASNNENIGSRLRPLDKGAVFEGKIRFSNLKKEELGLLLWSIRLEDGCKMNIGKAKPYGYGVIQFSDIKARVFDLQKAYETLNFDPFVSIDIPGCIQTFKEIISERTGVDNIMEMSRIREFFAMKQNYPNSEKIRYMSLAKDKKEYQNRKGRPLQKIPEIARTAEKEGFSADDK